METMQEFIKIEKAMLHITELVVGSINMETDWYKTEGCTEVTLYIGMFSRAIFVFCGSMIAALCSHINTIT